MASGDVLFVLKPLGSSPPATLYATFDTITETSTPNTPIPVLDFDSTTAEYMDWHEVIPSQYAGTTGFDFVFHYASDGTGAGTVKWDAKVLQLNDLDILTGDLGIDGLTAGTVTDTVPATPINKLNITAAASLAKANMSTPAAGDSIIIRIGRDTATDTLAHDAQLIAVYVTET